MFSIRHFLLYCFVPCLLYAAEIQTFYGKVEVTEPLLLELIEHPMFQRLKFIHQYGVAYYTTHGEEYSRYDHCLGVFAILRAKNASLEEQVAGLLHDVSHTVFSHVGDWIFGKEYLEEDYQTLTHTSFLRKSGLEDVLKKHGFTAEQILPTEELFPMLEQKAPDLCADRIDYNIQGAYYQEFITYEEALQIFHDLQFIDGKWVSTRPELIAKLVRFSLFMLEDCWGSAKNYLSSRCLADAILRGVSIGLISYKDIHFSIDSIIWDRLINSEDPVIREKMCILTRAEAYFQLVDPSEADFIIKSKFRGINPLILIDGDIKRIISIDPLLSEEYQSMKETISRGWAVKWLIADCSLLLK